MDGQLSFATLDYAGRGFFDLARLSAMGVVAPGWGGSLPGAWRPRLLKGANVPPEPPRRQCAPLRNSCRF
jgi:hypothetical protein